MTDNLSHGNGLRTVTTTFVGSKMTSPALVVRLHDMRRDVYPALPGFLSSDVLVNELANRVVEHVRWSTREAFESARDDEAFRGAFDALTVLCTRFERHVYHEATAADAVVLADEDQDD